MEKIIALVVVSCFWLFVVGPCLMSEPSDRYTLGVKNTLVVTVILMVMVSIIAAMNWAIGVLSGHI